MIELGQSLIWLCYNNIIFTFFAHFSSFTEILVFCGYFIKLWEIFDVCHSDSAIIACFIPLGFRYYSTKNGINNIKPAVIYTNSDTLKLQILKENKVKSGIYRWVNQETGESYVGSATNLYQRFQFYYSLLNIQEVLNRSKSRILNAILKYGYSKFSIEILEYCSPEKCIEREQYYIDLLNPEYNILKKAGSSFGHKHGEETRVKMSSVKRGETNPMFGKKHSEETLIKMSNAQKGRPRQEGSGRPSQKIEVTDIKKNITTTYDSITAAALALNIGQSTISKYLARKDQKFYKNQYGFKKL